MARNYAIIPLLFLVAWSCLNISTISASNELRGKAHGNNINSVVDSTDTSIKSEAQTMADKCATDPPTYISAKKIMCFAMDAGAGAGFGTAAVKFFTLYDDLKDSFNRDTGACTSTDAAVVTKCKLYKTIFYHGYTFWASAMKQCASTTTLGVCFGPANSDVSSSSLAAHTSGSDCQCASGRYCDSNTNLCEFYTDFSNELFTKMNSLREGLKAKNINMLVKDTKNTKTALKHAALSQAKTCEGKDARVVNSNSYLYFLLIDSVRTVSQILTDVQNAFSNEVSNFDPGNGNCRDGSRCFQTKGLLRGQYSTFYGAAKTDCPGPKTAIVLGFNSVSATDVERTSPYMLTGNPICPADRFYSNAIFLCVMKPRESADFLVKANTLRASQNGNNMNKLYRDDENLMEKVFIKVNLCEQVTSPVKLEAGVIYFFVKETAVITNHADGTAILSLNFDFWKDSYSTVSGNCNSATSNSEKFKCQAYKAFVQASHTKFYAAYKTDCLDNNGKALTYITAGIKTTLTDITAMGTPFTTGTVSNCGTGRFWNFRAKLCDIKNTKLDVAAAIANDIRQNVLAVNMNELEQENVDPNTKISLQNLAYSLSQSCMGPKTDTQSGVGVYVVLNVPKDARSIEQWVKTRIDEAKGHLDPGSKNCKTNLDCKPFKVFAFPTFEKVAASHKECVPNKVVIAFAFSSGGSGVISNPATYIIGPTGLCHSTRFFDSDKKLCRKNALTSDSYLVELNRKRGALESSNIKKLFQNVETDNEAQKVVWKCEATSTDPKRKGSVNILNLLEDGQLTESQVEDKFVELYTSKKVTFDESNGACTGANCKFWKALTEKDAVNGAVYYNKKCNGDTKTAIVLAFGGGAAITASLVPYLKSNEAMCESRFFYNLDENLCMEHTVSDSKLINLVNTLRGSVGADNMNYLKQDDSKLKKSPRNLAPTIAVKCESTGQSFHSDPPTIVVKLLSSGKLTVDQVVIAIIAQFNKGKTEYDSSTGSCAGASDAPSCEWYKAFTKADYETFDVAFNDTCQSKTKTSIVIVFSPATSTSLSGNHLFRKTGRRNCPTGRSYDTATKLCRHTPGGGPPLLAKLNGIRTAQDGANINRLAADSTLDLAVSSETFKCSAATPQAQRISNKVEMRFLEDGVLDAAAVESKLQSSFDSWKTAFEANSFNCKSGQTSKCVNFRAFTYAGYRDCAAYFNNKCFGPKTSIVIMWFESPADLISMTDPYEKSSVPNCPTSRFYNVFSKLCDTGAIRDLKLLSKLNSLRGGLQATLNELYEDGIPEKTSLKYVALSIAKSCPTEEIKYDSTHKAMVYIWQANGALAVTGVESAMYTQFVLEDGKYDKAQGKCTGSDPTACKGFLVLARDNYDIAEIAFYSRCSGGKTSIVIVLGEGKTSYLSVTPPYKKEPSPACPSDRFYNSNYLCRYRPVSFSLESLNTLRGDLKAVDINLLYPFTPDETLVKTEAAACVTHTTTKSGVTIVSILKDGRLETDTQKSDALNNIFTTMKAGFAEATQACVSGKDDECAVFKTLTRKEFDKAAIYFYKGCPNVKTSVLFIFEGIGAITPYQKGTDCKCGTGKYCNIDTNLCENEYIGSAAMVEKMNQLRGALKPKNMNFLAVDKSAKVKSLRNVVASYAKKCEDSNQVFNSDPPSIIYKLKLDKPPNPDIDFVKSEMKKEFDSQETKYNMDTGACTDAGDAAKCKAFKVLTRRDYTEAAGSFNPSCPGNKVTIVLGFSPGASDKMTESTPFLTAGSPNCPNGRFHHVEEFLCKISPPAVPSILDTLNTFRGNLKSSNMNHLLSDFELTNVAPTITMKCLPNQPVTNYAAKKYINYFVLADNAVLTLDQVKQKINDHLTNSKSGYDESKEECVAGKEQECKNFKAMAYARNSGVAAYYRTDCPSFKTSIVLMFTAGTGDVSDIKKPYKKGTECTCESRRFCDVFSSLCVLHTDEGWEQKFVDAVNSVRGSVQAKNMNEVTLDTNTAVKSLRNTVASIVKKCETGKAEFLADPPMIYISLAGGSFTDDGIVKTTIQTKLAAESSKYDRNTGGCTGSDDCKIYKALTYGGYETSVINYNPACSEASWTGITIGFTVGKSAILTDNFPWKDDDATRCPATRFPDKDMYLCRGSPPGGAELLTLINKIHSDMKTSDINKLDQNEDIDSYVKAEALKCAPASKATTNNAKNIDFIHLLEDGVLNSNQVVSVITSFANTAKTGYDESNKQCVAGKETECTNFKALFYKGYHHAAVFYNPKCPNSKTSIVLGFSKSSGNIDARTTIYTKGEDCSCETGRFCSYLSNLCEELPPSSPELHSLVNKLRGLLRSTNMNYVAQSTDKAIKSLPNIVPTLAKECGAAEVVFRDDPPIIYIRLKIDGKLSSTQVKSQVLSYIERERAKYDEETGKCVGADQTACKGFKALTHHAYQSMEIRYYPSCPGPQTSIVIGLAVGKPSMLIDDYPWSRDKKLGCPDGWFMGRNVIYLCYPVPKGGASLVKKMNELRGGLKSSDINFLTSAALNSPLADTVMVMSKNCEEATDGAIIERDFKIIRLLTNVNNDAEAAQKLDTLFTQSKAGYSETTGLCESGKAKQCLNFKALAYAGHTEAAIYYNECPNSKASIVLGFGGSLTTYDAMVPVYRKGERCYCNEDRYCDNVAYLCVPVPEGSLDIFNLLNKLRGSIKATNMKELIPDEGIYRTSLRNFVHTEAAKCGADQGTSMVEDRLFVVQRILVGGIADVDGVKKNIEDHFRNLKASYDEKKGACKTSNDELCKSYKGISYSGYDNAVASYYNKCSDKRTRIVLGFHGGKKSVLTDESPYAQAFYYSCPVDRFYDKTVYLCRFKATGGPPTLPILNSLRGTLNAFDVNELASDSSIDLKATRQALVCNNPTCYPVSEGNITYIRLIEKGVLDSNLVEARVKAYFAASKKSYDESNGKCRYLQFRQCMDFVLMSYWSHKYGTVVFNNRCVGEKTSIIMAFPEKPFSVLSLGHAYDRSGSKKCEKGRDRSSEKKLCVELSKTTQKTTARPTSAAATTTKLQITMPPGYGPQLLASFWTVVIGVLFVFGQRLHN